MSRGYSLRTEIIRFAIRFVPHPIQPYSNGQTALEAITTLRTEAHPPSFATHRASTKTAVESGNVGDTYHSPSLPAVPIPSHRLWAHSPPTLAPEHPRQATTLDAEDAGR
ncbi:hypothetical protein CC2G_005105 [Coprinopsis cinerea AmutBmut pab1-1]|nr:hypothetical protein CC2G_005105 [Coprinopsis cinerea AmutBmut pab1-1]